MLLVAGGALYNCGEMEGVHHGLFGEVASYDDNPCFRACVHEPDHSPDVTSKGRYRFPKSAVIERLSATAHGMSERELDIVLLRTENFGFRSREYPSQAKGA
jgi:hypothetical protein